MMKTVPLRNPSHSRSRSREIVKSPHDSSVNPDTGKINFALTSKVQSLQATSENGTTVQENQETRGRSNKENEIIKLLLTNFEGQTKS